MSRAICASLVGEQGSATAFINQGRYQGWVRGVDYRLTEKAVGAGINGRRQVKIEWEGVEGMNPWRFGLSAATGMEPPDQLFANSGRQLAGWRVQLPMFTAATRAKYAAAAGALGVYSNRDMVDLYSQVLEDEEAPDAIRNRAEGLRSAYTAAGDVAKVTAMSAIWRGAAAGADYHGALVMTARAAALIRPDDAHAASADGLIASMLTAGLDRNAAAWANIVGEGTLGWALTALAAPRRAQPVEYGALDDFYGNDNSESAHKSALLLAGLAGLGRVDAEAQTDFGGDLEINVTRQTAWSRAITAAAERGEQGTVALMAIAGLQAPSWSIVPANHLYYIVRSLRQVGLEAEARMIAAEAVTFADLPRADGQRHRPYPSFPRNDGGRARSREKTLSAYRSDLVAASVTIEGRLVQADADLLAKLASNWAAWPTVRSRARHRRCAAFYGFLHEEGLRADDPSPALPKPVQARPLPKILNKAEVDLLFQSIERRLSSRIRRPKITASLRY